MIAPSFVQIVFAEAVVRAVKLRLKQLFAAWL